MKIKDTLLLSLLLLIASCNKDDDPKSPIDQLPPATQTGEQTFGCLIDGEAFVPDKFGSGTPNAFYQYVNSAYTLGISGSNGGGPNMKSIGLGAIDIIGIEVGEYDLVSEGPGNFHGRYNIGGGIELRTATMDENPGKLIITKYDLNNFILSGTFEFTVLDNQNKEIKITNGRFDLKYTN